MFIGLMGVSDDGCLISPSGKKLFWVPLWLGAIIQRIQHWVAQKTWNFEGKK